MKRLTAPFDEPGPGAGPGRVQRPLQPGGAWTWTTPWWSITRPPATPGRPPGYIASITGADVFEIVPADPYTSEDLTWTDPESRVSTEHDARVAGETVAVELTQTTP